MDLSLQSFSSIFPHFITGQKTFLKKQNPCSNSTNLYNITKRGDITAAALSSFSPILLVFFFIHALMMSTYLS